MFGRDFLWAERLPSSVVRSGLSRPPKVEYVYQTLKRECWEGGTVEIKELDKSLVLLYGECASDGSWMIAGGFHGNVFVIRELESDSPTIEKIGGEGFPLNPHQSQGIVRCLVSPDCSSAFTFGYAGSFVKWKGLASNQITVTPIAGKDCPINPHQFSIQSGAISSDGKCGLTFGWMKEEGVYWRGLDTDSPTPILLPNTRERGHEQRDSERYWACCGCKLSPDGSWAIVVGESNPDGFVEIWRGFHTEKIQRTVVKNSPHQSPVLDCVISLDDSWALTVDKKGKLIQWRDLQRDAPTPTLIELPSLDYPTLKLSPDGSWAIVGSGRDFFVVHHLNETPVVTPVLQPIPCSLLCIAPSSSAFFFSEIHNLSRLSPPIKCTEDIDVKGNFN